MEAGQGDLPSANPIHSWHYRPSATVQAGERELKNVLRFARIFVPAVCLLIAAATALIAQTVEAVLLAGALGGLAAVWATSPFIAYRYGQVASLRLAEQILKLAGQTEFSESLIKLTRDTSRKFTLVFVVTFGIFAVIFVTPAASLAAFLVAIPAYLVGRYTGFRRGINSEEGSALIAANSSHPWLLQQRLSAATDVIVPAREAAERGAEAVKLAIHGGNLAQPLRITLNPEHDTLEVGSLRLHVAEILEANVVEKRHEGMASTVATVVGVSALGPLGILLGRAARDTKLAQRGQIAIKLIVDDTREPIRILEITPEALPTQSANFLQVRKEADKVVAQLKVLIARRNRISNSH